MLESEQPGWMYNVHVLQMLHWLPKWLVATVLSTVLDQNDLCNSYSDLKGVGRIFDVVRPLCA